jgi:hypothetical protein
MQFLADYIPAVPVYRKTLYALGMLAFSMGDEKTAPAFFKRAFELEPGLWLKALDDRDLDSYREGKK